MVLAARGYGLDEAVLASASKTLTRPFMATVESLTPSGVIHAKRRTEEVEMAAEAVEDAGIEPIMTRATAARLRWKESLGPQGSFQGRRSRKLQDRHRRHRDQDAGRTASQSGRVGPRARKERTYGYARAGTRPARKGDDAQGLLRLVPFLMICYFCALLDRVNVGFAALADEQGSGADPGHVRLRREPVLRLLLPGRGAEQPGAAEVRAPGAGSPGS